MEVQNKFENKLLNRIEVQGSIAGSGSTPTRYEVKSALAKQLKVKEDLVIVNKIDSHYGSATVSIEANVYNDQETLERLTPKHILKRNTGAAPAPVEEEAPAQEEAPAAQEAPAQESTEEAPKAEEEVKEE